MKFFQEKPTADATLPSDGVSVAALSPLLKGLKRRVVVLFRVADIDPTRKHYLVFSIPTFTLCKGKSTQHLITMMMTYLNGGRFVSFSFAFIAGV